MKYRLGPKYTDHKSRTGKSLKWNDKPPSGNYIYSGWCCAAVLLKAKNGKRILPHQGSLFTRDTVPQCRPGTMPTPFWDLGWSSGRQNQLWTLTQHSQRTSILVLVQAPPDPERTGVQPLIPPSMTVCWMKETGPTHLAWAIIWDTLLPHMGRMAIMPWHIRCLLQY